MLSFHIYGQISNRVSDTFLPSISPCSTTNKTKSWTKTAFIIIIIVIIIIIIIIIMGRDSSVGTATRYGLDNSGIESRWGRDFHFHLKMV
jgi:hypothetical protein